MVELPAKPTLVKVELAADVLGVPVSVLSLPV